MEKYFLVARDIHTNQFSIIKLNDSWYLDKEKPLYQWHRNHDLFAIDLVTMRFSNATEMIERMNKNGYLFSKDVDLFIAKRIHSQGNIFLKTYEVMYQFNPQERFNLFRKIATSFVQNNVDCFLEDRKLVYNQFCTKMFYSHQFSRFVYMNYTNIPKKIVDYFYSLPPLESPNYSILYKKSWLLDNYPTIRSIIESFNRFDQQDQIQESLMEQKRIQKDRCLIFERLCRVMDPSFIEGQLDLLDFFEDKSVDECLISDIDVTKTNYIVSDSLKKEYIFKTIDQLSLDIFSVNKKGVFIQTNLISSDLDLKEHLENSLDSSFLSLIYFYVLHHLQYQFAYQNNYNTIHLEKELRIDREKIQNQIKNKRKLSQLYEWCKLYQKLLCSSNSEVKSFEKRCNEVY